MALSGLGFVQPLPPPAVAHWLPVQLLLTAHCPLLITWAITNSVQPTMVCHPDMAPVGHAVCITAVNTFHPLPLYRTLPSLSLISTIPDALYFCTKTGS